MRAAGLAIAGGPPETSASVRSCSPLPYRLSGATGESTNPVPSAGGLVSDAEVAAAFRWAREYLGGVRDQARIREAWVGFLSAWRWDWFCSLTSRDAIHAEQLDKRFRYWIYEANCELYPHRVHKRIAHGLERRDLRLKRGEGIYWCRAAEYQKRGVLHYHVLVGGVGRLRRLSYMDLWNKLCGFAKVEVPRSDDLVARYVAKYCMKSSGLGEIDLGGTLARYKPFVGLPA